MCAGILSGTKRSIRGMTLDGDEAKTNRSTVTRPKGTEFESDQMSLDPGVFVAQATDQT
jgi:hypothetical protein